MERTYTIPLRRQFLKSSKYMRTNKAVRTVKMFLQRHMKTQDVRLGEELNKALWARGDSHPPHKVTVVVKKEDDIAYAEIAGKEFKKKDFSEKEDKKETKSVEAAVKKEEQKPAEQIIGEAAVTKTKENEKKETKSEAKVEKPKAKKLSKKK